MAIDGTWQPVCMIHDVSEMGVKLVIDGTVRDIGQKEFLLVLSPLGLAYRYCELSWVNGEFVGVHSSSVAAQLKESATRRNLG